MSDPLPVWPVMHQDTISVDDIQIRQPTAMAALRNDSDLAGLEVLIWRHPDKTAIISNRIRWIEAKNGRFRYRSTKHYGIAETRAVLELTQGSTASSIQDIAKSLPIKSPEGEACPGWISFMLTRHGILLSSFGARKIGKNEDWRGALLQEAQIPGSDLRQMAENGLKLLVGGQVATLITGAQHVISSHQQLRQHDEIREFLSQHIAQVCELMPIDKRICLHPEWTPLSPP